MKKVEVEQRDKGAGSLNLEKVFKEFPFGEGTIEQRHGWSERANEMVTVGRLFQAMIVDVHMSEAEAVWYVSEELHGSSEAREEWGTGRTVGSKATEGIGVRLCWILEDKIPSTLPL